MDTGYGQQESIQLSFFMSPGKPPIPKPVLTVRIIRVTRNLRA